jgi:tetratricopeptide (TPR) repeat protein
MNRGSKIKRFVGGMLVVPGMVLALFFVLTLPGFGADISATFDSANKLYEQGKFTDAVAAYNKLVQAGTVSPAIYFNLGNAYFKSGQVGRAIAAFREAENLAPRDPDVRANLQFIRARVQAPSASPTVSWQQWLTTLTVNEWAILSVIILWVWLGLWVLIQFRPQLKQSLRVVLWCGGAAIFICGGCTYAAWSSESRKTAIVVAKDAMLHNGPLEEAPATITVHDGAELPVIDTKNDWLQVRVDNQHVGWLKREQVALGSGV